jgi:hypothetical protein
MKLNYDKSKVYWNFEGKQYEYLIEDVDDAFLETNHIHIMLSNMKNKTGGRVFITLTGKLIASCNSTYSFNTEIITALDENGKKLNIEIPYFMDMCANDKNIYVLAGKGYEEKLIRYSLYGEKLKEYLSPKDWVIRGFFNFADNDKEIELVCASKKEQDDWVLSLNLETEEWTKMHIVR